MMKRILVPTDFSGVALEAFRFAVDLSSSSGGELLALHIVDVPVSYSTELDGFNYTIDPMVVKAIHDNAHNKFEKWKKKYGGTAEKISFYVENGSTFVTIENFIKENKIDLVVMGTHGASGLKEFFIGSNTEKIVRFSKVPVFAIKKAVKLSTIRNIIFPTQLKLNENELVKRVKELQEFFKAILQIIYINTPTNFRSHHELNGLLEDYVKHYAFTNYDTQIVNDPYEQHGIIAFANETPGRIIAMATHGRRGLAHFFNQSIAEDVVNHVDCPIWTYSIGK